MLVLLENKRFTIEGQKIVKSTTNNIQKMQRNANMIKSVKFDKNSIGNP